MKKIVFALLTFVSIGIKLNAQNFDDGKVTRYLNVDINDAKYSQFAEKFRNGIETVKSGRWTSMDDVAAATGVDLRKFPKLSQLGSGSGVTGISDELIRKFQVAVNNTDIVYKTIGDFRNELVNIATHTSLSEKDAEVLAYADVATQEIARSLIVDESSAFSGNIPFADDAGFNENSSIEQQKTEGSKAVTIDDLRLPRWVRCALGTLGSAIIGGLGGAATGAQIGSVVPGAGNAIGAVIGGIGGVIGGTFTGIATFCD